MAIVVELLFSVWLLPEFVADDAAVEDDDDDDDDDNVGLFATSLAI